LSFPAKQQRKILHERFQTSLEKKMIWTKNLKCALDIFDVSLSIISY